MYAVFKSRCEGKIYLGKLGADGKTIVKSILNNRV